MCAPIALAAASFAIGAAQSVAQFQAQSEDAKAQEQAFWQNRSSALAAAADKQKSLAVREIQEGEKTTQKVSSSLREEAEKQAQARVSAAVGGVSGISVDNIVSDLGRRAAANRAVAEENYRNIALQLADERRATEAEAQTRINSVQRGRKPSTASLALGIAGAGVKAFGSYM